MDERILVIGVPLNRALARFMKRRGIDPENRGSARAAAAKDPLILRDLLAAGEITRLFREECQKAQAAIEAMAEAEEREFEETAENLQ
jgi:hypothetical protein